MPDLVSSGLLRLGSVVSAASFDPGFASENRWLWGIFVQWPITLAPALFTWLLPAILRYRRGGMAWIGAAVAVAFTVALPLQGLSSAWKAGYEHIHPWLYGVFYVYALAGLSLCAVGLYDRKRSAVWATLAVLSLTGGAIADTLIWFGVFRSVPWVPWGFIGFWFFIAIGFVRRRADPPERFDVRESARTLAKNRTRRARSISRKLLREGELHWLPVYRVVMLSDMAREGIMNSGSYRFADHIYRAEPSGITALGRRIDRHLLGLPATRAFRLRYKRAQIEMRRALEAFPADERPLYVLAIPCGLPRDLNEFAATVAVENPSLLARLEYHGMDIDPELLQLAREFTDGSGVPRRKFFQGNALVETDFQRMGYHFIMSTGLGEFLNTPELETFYRNVYASLRTGGTFYTSATRHERRSEAFLRAFELITQYRTTRELERILTKFPWSRLTLAQDDSGLQTFVVAVK